MADFKTSYAILAKNEGGYTVDNGGETYKGISRKGWPKWNGWPLIDEYKRKFGRLRKGQFINSPAIDAAVLEFYRKNYWQVIMGDYIKNQQIANFIFDYYVNSNGAMIVINKGLGARVTRSINEDSLKIINERPAFAYQVIYNARKNNYTNLSKNPALTKYAREWFARLDRFPKQISTFSFDPYSFNA